MSFTPLTRIGVLGAGAMGSGIAQVAAGAGHPVVLGDVSAPQLEKAKAGIARAMRREVDKGRKSAPEAEAVTTRIETAATADGFAAFEGCGFIIEAIAEDLAIKQQVFAAIEKSAPDATLGTNTSSLSVTAIASACTRPGQVVGAHFFNPAPVMPLVEIIGGHSTDPERLAEVRALIDSWGKLTVTAADTPGFIVNRVARPFYNESLRLLEEGIADHATIDWAMKEYGGFRMGPFELMDLIGNDINYAVTRSVFDAFGYEPRYRPSLLQRRMVEAKLLGRKTGRGWYDYREGAVAPEPDRNEERGRGIAGRVVVMLINEAADAVLFRVATAADVDRAMIKGVGYPKGLLEWADEIGIPGVVGRLAALQGEYGEDRYRASALLRRMARLDQKFYP
jgi:3-hydroxybutyryl-CoA dehydrogenase